MTSYTGLPVIKINMAVLVVFSTWSKVDIGITSVIFCDIIHMIGSSKA